MDDDTLAGLLERVVGLEKRVKALEGWTASTYYCFECGSEYETVSERAACARSCGRANIEQGDQ